MFRRCQLAMEQSWNDDPETTVLKHDVTHTKTVCSLITLWKKNAKGYQGKGFIKILKS